MQGIFTGWPEGKRAAVALSFDDAAPSQLDHAIPILDEHGLPGTFYVNPGRSGGRFEQRLEEWRRAHRQGHELGNHTVKHPCSCNFPFVGETRALELWSLADLEADVQEAATRLEDLIPGLGEVSFAYPCGQTFVGRGAGRRSYVPVIARHFGVARGVGESANDPRICDLHCLSSWMVEGLSGRELIAMAEPAVANGHWAIFCFHGVGGDHIAVAKEAFAELVAYLARNEESIWTATVQEIGTFVASLQAADGAGPAEDDRKG